VDISHSILDSQFVLNLLHNLNPRFSSTTDNIVDADPLPDFTTTR
jgi:hypothetical protein